MIGSTNRNFKQFGMPKPFSHPIPLPDVYWNSTASQGILVPDHWIPVIVGAMAVLQSEEVWERDDDSVRQEVVNGATQLAAAWQRLLPFGEPIDWRGDCDCTHGVQKDIFNSNYYAPFDNLLDWERESWLFINDSDPIETMTTNFHYYEIGTLNQVGVETESFTIVPQFETDLMHIAVFDCFDNEITLDSVGTTHMSDVFEDTDTHVIKAVFCTSYTGLMHFLIGGKGLFQCGVA